MKILQLHSNFIKYEIIEKEIELAEDIKKKGDHLEELAVLFIAIEKGDGLDVAKTSIPQDHLIPFRFLICHTDRTPL